MILDTVHKTRLDTLRHAYFMREVVSKYKSMLLEYEAADPSTSDLDFIPHGINESDIPSSVLPLLDWHATEHSYGADYHGPLPTSSSLLPSNL